MGTIKTLATWRRLLMFKHSIFDTVEAYAWATMAPYEDYVKFHKLAGCRGKLVSAKTYSLICDAIENDMCENMAKDAAGGFGKIDTEIVRV